MTGAPLSHGSSGTGDSGASHCNWQWGGRICWDERSWEPPLSSDAAFLLRLLHALPLRAADARTDFPISRRLPAVLRLLTVLPLALLSAARRHPALALTSPSDAAHPPLALLLSALLRPAHALLLSAEGSAPFSPLYLTVYVDVAGSAVMERLDVAGAVEADCELPSAEGHSGAPAEPPGDAGAARRARMERRARRSSARAALLGPLAALIGQSSASGRPPPSPPLRRAPPARTAVQSPASSNRALCRSLFCSAAQRLRRAPSSEAALALSLNVESAVRAALGERRWGTERLSDRQMTRAMKAHVSPVLRQFLQALKAGGSRERPPRPVPLSILR